MYPQSMFLSKNKKNIIFLSSENYHFYNHKNCNVLHRHVFVVDSFVVVYSVARLYCLPYVHCSKELKEHLTFSHILLSVKHPKV